MNKIDEYIKKYDIVILIILGFLFYLPALFYGFVYDDVGFLLQNQYLNGSIQVHFFDFFKPNYIMKFIYNPLTFIVQWLIIKFFGSNSFSFHFINIVFYILSYIALFYLLKKILNNNYYIAFFSVILYILHPCHIECVAWIGAMGYNIASIFFFLSFLYFIIAFDENKKLNYIYSIVFYILAILSQPIAVTLPAILFLWIFCFRWNKFKESIIFIVSYLPFLFVYLFLYYQTILKTSRFEENLNYILLDKLSIWGFNLFNSFIPINLCPMQSLPKHLFIITLLVLFILVYIFRKNIYFIFFCCFGIICFLPYSNIFFNINIPVADRYLLLSSISSSVFISYLSIYFFEKFKNKYLIKYLSFFFFIILYLFSFSIYLPVWKDDRTLWRYAYNVNSDNLYIVAKYSLYLYDDGQYDTALVVLNNVIQKPQKKSLSWVYDAEYTIYKLKSKILMKKGMLDESLNVALKLKELKPKYYETYFYLFDVYMGKKDYDEAIKVFKIADEICKKDNLYKKSDIFLSFNNKKIILDFILSRPDEFIDSFKIISNDFKLLGDNGEFSKILEKKDYKNREEICLNYLRKYNTEYSRYVINLLVALYMQNVYKEKASHIMRSLLDDMDKAEDFIKKGDNKSVEEIYLSIISKNEYMYVAYKNLGVLYLQTNRQDKAKDIFMKMLKINPNDNEIRRFIIDYLEN